MSWRSRWRGTVVVAGLALVGCAAETSPLVRQDLATVRADIAQLEQSVQKNQAEVKADLQQADRRGAQTLAELQRSVARLSSQLDDMSQDRARMEGQLDQLRRQVEALGLQFDVGAAPRPGAPPMATPPAQTAIPQPPQPSTPPGTRGPDPAGGPEGAPAVGEATGLYQSAYMDYTRGNYHLAIAGFEEFVRRYPETDLAEKAQYWIGESHFSLAQELQAREERGTAIREFERARQEFRNVLIKYPRGDRVPAALYKEALALLDPREREVVRLRYGIGRDSAHTLREIGSIVKLSRERVRQIVVSALNKLRLAHPLRDFVSSPPGR